MTQGRAVSMGVMTPGSGDIGGDHPLRVLAGSDGLFPVSPHLAACIAEIPQAVSKAPDLLITSQGRLLNSLHIKIPKSGWFALKESGGSVSHSETRCSEKRPVRL